MPVWAWILIGVVVVAAIAAAVWAASRKRRTERLRETFGPEYDREIRLADRRRAESELEARELRRKDLDIRPLEPAARRRFLEAWQTTQAKFVDAPSESVREADGLVTRVMVERGYPMEDFEQRSADISVDHPNVVENYRAAHAISLANDSEAATTEDLRQAMVHFRTLFEDLLETRSDEGDRMEQAR
jgi:hypothetical protein